MVYKLFVFNRNTWNHKMVHKRLLTNKTKCNFFQFNKIQLNIENIMITIKHLQINQMLALNNP